MDDFGQDILINGVSTENQVTHVSEFSIFRSFSVTSGFVSGINTLDFVIQDSGGAAGFRVGSLSGTATRTASVVPEPSSLALMGLGVVGLWTCSVRRRRRDATK